MNFKEHICLSTFAESCACCWIYKIRQKKKSCLVVLHRPPLIFENWKKVFTVQKYTAPNFQNSPPPKKSFFFFENFDLFKNISCCFQLVYILILVLNLYKDIFGKVDLFAHLLGDIEAIIPCSFDFDLKKKKNPPARPFSKKLWRTTKQLFLGLICSKAETSFVSDWSMKSSYDYFCWSMYSD